MRMIGAHPTISPRARANGKCSDRARRTTGAARQSLLAIVLVWAAGASAAEPLRARDLSPRVEWRVGSVRIEGNEHVPTRALRPLLATRPRAFLAPWRRRPRFEREVLVDDLARLAAFYRGRGYYQTRVTYGLVPDPRRETVAVTIHIDEGPAILVATLRVDLKDAPATAPPLETASLVPLAVGDVFDEARYDEGRARLFAWARAAHFARAHVTRRARVDVAAGTAEVFYTVRFGPPSFFGPVAIEGLARVTPEIVRREIAFVEGAPFDPALLERTRRNLLRLRLFRSVTLREDDTEADEVAITIRVTEGPHREIRAGIGYDTVEEIRGLLAWRTYDFLGGARQLGLTARASTLRQAITADFLQPHWPIRNARARLLVSFENDAEDTFTLRRGRLAPRLEWAPVPHVLGFLGYRLDRAHLHSVDGAVRRALPPEATPRYATLSGLNLGLDWNRTDDLLNPTRGFIVTTAVDPVGSIFGGDVGFVRLLGTLRLYVPLPWRVVASTRLRAGTIEPIAGSNEVVLWERFYAGGIDSVRGYARWRVGPLNRDQPLGGRSLSEASFELRRALTPQVALTTFFDAGQLSLQSFDLPLDDLQKGVGCGLQYSTPIGPVRFDLGVPLDRRGDDASWQVYLSVGQVF